MKKKIIILGFQRTGTNLIKEFYYKYCNYKSNSKTRVKNKQIYIGLKRDDIFKFENNNFYIFQIWKKKKYKKISKTEIKKKYILSTHNYNKNLFKIFEKHEFLISIRNPIDTIASNINYVTKKNVMLFNKNYKIKNNFELIKNRKLVKKHISNYFFFYKKIFNLKQKKYILINYDEAKKKLARINELNVKSIKFKNFSLHSTRDDPYIKNYLINNYKLKKCFEIYNKILKINQ